MQHQDHWITLAETPLETSAEELESLLQSEQHDLVVRVKLIGHYFTNMFRGDCDARRVRHVLWLIANHPEVSVGGYGTIDPSRWPMEYSRGQRLWLSAAERYDDVNVVWNALSFVLIHDRPTAFRLAKQGLALTQESRWHQCLGFLNSSEWYSSSAQEAQYSHARMAMQNYSDAIAIETNPKVIYRLHVELARSASRCGEHIRAHGIATQVLIDSASFANEASIGRDLHYAHVVIGNCMLASGSVAEARGRLDTSMVAKPRFSAGGLLGPEFSLAQGLLSYNEIACVVQFIQACESAWPYPNHLWRWRRLAESGGVPSFRLDGNEPP